MSTSGDFSDTYQLRCLLFQLIFDPYVFFYSSSCRAYIKLPQLTASGESKIADNYICFPLGFLMEGVIEVNFQNELISFSLLLSRKSYLSLKTLNQVFNQKNIIHWTTLHKCRFWVKAGLNWWGYNATLILMIWIWCLETILRLDEESCSRKCFFFCLSPWLFSCYGISGVPFFTAGNFCREDRKPCLFDICNFRL